MSVDPVAFMIGDPEGFENVLGKKFSEYMADPQGFNNYSYVKNNPLKYVDPWGLDAVVTIDEDSKSITIEANIFIYGEDASQFQADEIESYIMSSWNNGDEGWKYDGYDVHFDVNVELYDDEFTWYDKFSDKTNLIKIDESTPRSFVDFVAYKGKWAGWQDVAHEFGHLVGLDEQYTEGFGIHLGWETNIMGNSFHGKVEQRNIDRIVSEYVNKHRNRWFPGVNRITEYVIAPRSNVDMK